MKKCINFDAPAGQEEIGQHFHINCSKIAHSYEAFTYQFGRNNYTPLLSANKNYSADLLKLGVTGNFVLI